MINLLTYMLILRLTLLILNCFYIYQIVTASLHFKALTFFISFKFCKGFRSFKVILLFIHLAICCNSTVEGETFEEKFHVAVLLLFKVIGVGPLQGNRKIMT